MQYHSDMNWNVCMEGYITEPRGNVAKKLLVFVLIRAECSVVGTWYEWGRGATGGGGRRQQILGSLVALQCSPGHQPAHVNHGRRGSFVRQRKKRIGSGSVISRETFSC